jgi:transposase
MALVEEKGLPIALNLHSAKPHESTLTFDLVQDCVTEELPERAIGDSAFDSDALDAAFAEIGIEFIAPHRKNRKNKTQDGRMLRRAKRRWKVERFFAHLQNFRRMIVRYERKSANYLGLLHMVATIILVRNYF